MAEIKGSLAAARDQHTDPPLCGLMQSDRWYDSCLHYRVFVDPCAGRGACMGIICVFVDA